MLLHIKTSINIYRVCFYACLIIFIKKNNVFNSTDDSTKSPALNDILSWETDVVEVERLASWNR